MQTCSFSPPLTYLIPCLSPTQIRFWKKDNPDDVRTEDVILRDWNPCPPLDANRRLRRSTSEVKAHTNNLWPYSDLVAGVLTLNGRKSGDLSDTISFRTPEGVPAAVASFLIMERGSHHLKLRWTPPLTFNGVPLVYIVGYKTGNILFAIVFLT